MFAKCQYMDISIHAPARGATRNPGCKLADMEDFNPRSREGSDWMWGVCSSICNISIHAPARGATIHRGHLDFRLSYFNPRSREGSDFNFI